MKLLNNNVLISKYEEEEKTSSLVLAEATDNFISVGIVEGWGGCEGYSGFDLKNGDKVRVSKFAGEEFTKDGKRMKIVDAKHILAIED